MRLVTKTCKMCGTEFDGYGKACYCSDACRREYETAYHRHWREKNREHYREYMRDYMRTGVIHRGI